MSKKETISRDERLFNIGWDAALEFTEASRDARDLRLLAASAKYANLSDEEILKRFNEEER